MVLTIHIGHHFFGAGNIGDDWMLAGFLSEIDCSELSTRITCCTPFDRAAMSRRFPAVEWLAYDTKTRQTAISAADAWLGVGGTPFQSSVGTWLLDHIESDLNLCAERGVPTFFIGVGVENEGALMLPQCTRIFAKTTHIWTRDTRSAGALVRAGFPPGQVTEGADLAHLFFASRGNSARQTAAHAGLVINVEDTNQLRLAAFVDLIRKKPAQTFRWVAQEVRSFPNSEMYLWGAFDPSDRARMKLIKPDYTRGSTESFVSGYCDLRVLLSSRYHSAVAAAWLGVPLVVFPRSLKLAFLCDELDVIRCASLTDEESIVTSLSQAHSVPRKILDGRRAVAREACRHLFELLSLNKTESSPEDKGPLLTDKTGASVVAEPAVTSDQQNTNVRRGDGREPEPKTILFVRPDSYGDLVLFEPVIRAFRQRFADARIVTLIRDTHLDIVQLFRSTAEWVGCEARPYQATINDAEDVARKIEAIVDELHPDWVIAPCYEKTWVEAIAVAHACWARRISLGPAEFDPHTTAWLTRQGFEPSKLFSEMIDVARDAHEMDKAALVVTTLCGNDIPVPPPLLKTPPGAEKQVATFLAANQIARGGFILCAPAGGSNVAIKSWPPDRFAQVLISTAAPRQIPVVVVGAEGEIAIVDEVARLAIAGGVRAYAWTGKSGEIAVLAGLVRASAMYLGNDTGALHLAAAFHRPVVGIFGGGTWPRFIPRVRFGMAFVHPLPCFGCGWDCHFRDAPCVLLVSAKRVANKLDEWLQRPKSSRNFEIVETGKLDPILAASIRASRENYESLQRDRTDRMRQILELTDLARVHHSTVSRLEHSRLQLEASISHLEAEKARLNEHAAQTAVRIAELERQVRQRNEDGASWVHQIDLLNQWVREAQLDNAQRRQEVTELTTHLKIIEKESSDRLRQIDELTSLLRDFESARALQLAENHELSQLAQRTQEAVAARENQVASLISQIQALQQDSSDRLRQIDEFSALLRNSESARTSLLAQNQELHQLARHAQETAATQQNQIGLLSSQVQALQQDAPARLQRIEHLTELLKDTDHENARLLQRNIDLTEQAALSQSFSTSQRETIAELRLRVTAQEEYVGTVRENSLRLERRNEALSAENQALSKEVQTAGDQFAVRYADLKRLYDQLCADILAERKLADVAQARADAQKAEFLHVQKAHLKQMDQLAASLRERDELVMQLTADARATIQEHAELTRNFWVRAGRSFRLIRSKPNR